MYPSLVSRLLVSLLLILGGCSASDDPSQSGNQRAFHGAFPYQVPPVGHFNSFITNNIPSGIGIYWELLEQSLALYRWAEDIYYPLLATDWTWQGNTLRITLRQGVQWSDGSPFTSRDVVATYHLARLMNHLVWRFLERVEAVDDHTVVFHLTRPNAVIPRYVLRDIRVRAASVYGVWGERVAQLVADGEDKESEAWKALQQAFNDFRPPKLVTSGPFTIERENITESQLILTKVPTAWNADRVQFDRLVLYNGETPAITPVVLAKQVDYATHGFPPATAMQFEILEIRVLKPPIYTGPSLYLNHRLHPFELKEFRQALAYVINRSENAAVSGGDWAVAVRYPVGFSDNLVPHWLAEEDRARINPYERDLAKAERLLQDLRFRRDPDGVWLDDRGARLEFELAAAAEFVGHAAAAENLAEQLRDFGIKAVFRGVQFQQLPADIQQGRFQMVIQTWGAGNPHPYFAYVQDLFRFNNIGLLATDSGPGMDFPLRQTTTALGAVDLEQLVTASTEGSAEAQKQVITKLALAYNELLPQIPLWERYGNNPVVDGVRVTGWPPDDHPIYRNSPYLDSFAIQMILDGTLRPVRMDEWTNGRMSSQ